MSKWNCFGGTFQAVNEALGRMFNKGIGEDNLDKKVTGLLYHQFKNYIINGSFDPAVGWQRGTSFTLNSAETKYTADRWRCTQGTSGAGTVSYQAVPPGDVPGAIGSFGSLRWQQTTAATTAPEIMQPVESVYTFAGSVCTFSFWVKAAAATTIQIALRQNFGTSGTPSASVDIATQSFTIGTAWQRITATFTVPSIAGKTLGTNGNDYLGVRIILSAGATFDIQFTLIQLESGNTATGFEWRPRQQELVLEQRYCQLYSYPSRADPIAIGYCYSETEARFQFPYIQKIRAVPSVTTSSLSTFYCVSPGAVGLSPTSMTMSGLSQICGKFFAILSGLTIGRGIEMRTADGGGAWVLLDAEFYN